MTQTMLERAARAVGEVAATNIDDVRHVLTEPAMERVARAVLMAVRMEDGSDVAPLMGLEDSIAMDFLASDFTGVIDAILEGK